MGDSNVRQDNSITTDAATICHCMLDELISAPHDTRITLTIDLTEYTRVSNVQSVEPPQRFRNMLPLIGHVNCIRYNEDSNPEEVYFLSAGFLCLRN